MKTVAFAALATLAVFAGSAEARTSNAGGMRQAGTLTCNLDPAVGLVLGSIRHVECSHTYMVREGRKLRTVRESYAGDMKRAGFDVGVTGGQTVSWKVMTTGRTHRGMLNGAAAGSSADASIFAGSGTQATFGQNGQTIALQPVANSGQVGFGIGFGATELELRKVPTAAFTSLYY